METVGLGNIYPVIMAGGAGTRFWPVSRQLRPKQLLRLFGERTLLEDTVERVLPLAVPERVVVVTSEGIGDEVRRLLPAIPAQNVLCEPAARNTAAAIGFAASFVARQDPAGLLAVMPSDHFVVDIPAFLHVARSAAIYAQDGAIVTLGITPTRPETGYGYIRFGDYVPPPEGDLPEGPVQVARSIGAFVEKPTQAVALGYLKEGRYLWNAGVFFFRADVILGEIARFLPELDEGLKAVRAALDAPDPTEALRGVYPRLLSTSIDYGVMEHTDRIVVIPSSFGWSDVGSWQSLDDFREPGAPNAVQGEVIAIDATDNVLYGHDGMVVSAVGIEGLVVAASRDAVLVCPKERSQDVRRVVEELRRRGLDRLL
ncbi:MAG: mannose-1-phosphate guanylyltransferase [Myxococcales bacterium]